VALVHGDNFYVFGGFDGNARVNDFHQYNFEQQEWSMIPVLRGVPPSPRHSHAGVVYNGCMYIFGGYDGAYKNDFHEFNFGEHP
jgi:N-acetylneuraminic acid mutarotase